jgi:imidazolonepropionase
VTRRRADLIVRNATELIAGPVPTGGVRGRSFSRLPLIEDGAVAICDGRIAAWGSSSGIDREWSSEQCLDAAGCLVSPGFVDPHTHLVYAGSREDEWEQRVREQPAPPLEGGINRTVADTRAASTESLHAQALGDLSIALAHGTTTMECKSGYGLDRATEMRILQLLDALDAEQPVDLVPTFLGAHVVPLDHAEDRDAYVSEVVDMLADAAPLARSCDLTCDPAGFTTDECRRIGERARELGMPLRFHADQTGRSGGTALAAELRALSVDHLECASDEDIDALAASSTVGVLLPGVTHHLMHPTPSASGKPLPQTARMSPAKVRRMVQAGCCLALATDYNPGTCPALSLQAIMQLAARIYRLDYAEIWQMATINAAAALGLGGDRGSIEVGKLADVVIWNVPRHGMVINRFGHNLVHTVLKGGIAVVQRNELLLA